MHAVHLLVLIALLGAALPAPALAQAQPGPEVEMSVDYHFGEDIRFTASLRSEEPVESAFLFYTAEGDHHTPVKPVEVTPGEDDLYRLAHHDELDEWSPRAFARVEYWFEITLQDGEKFLTPKADFFYNDNRFDWQTLAEAPFKVYWYQGDLAFAQSVLDAAEAGLQRVLTLLPLEIPELVEIYVYPNASVMQETLSLSSKAWVAGHADPDLGVMVVALPDGPEQGLLMEQRIPHELMHIMLYESTGPGYASQPAWLREGLASAAELYPNPDYPLLLESARERRGLLPMSSLCQAFPRDTSGALLAYAQSASFTRYLHRTYGISGMETLVESYADGVGCERGLETSLGRSLAQLERGWRSSALSENVLLAALGNLLPWFVLLLAALGAPVVLGLAGLRSRSAGAQSR